MVAEKDVEAREKATSRLPAELWNRLKVRSAERGVDIQDVIEEALPLWINTPAHRTVSTSGAAPFSTWLPPGVFVRFKQECSARGVSIVQGLSQAVSLWLTRYPSPQKEAGVGTRHPRRKIVANQKGGVGKTAATAGVAQAYAEGSEFDGLGQRVLMVDFDPQGHLTSQLGYEALPLDSDSLVRHMTGEPTGAIEDLVVPVEDPRFGNRLDLLPACVDGFVLDVKLSTTRARESAIERALAPLEDNYDVIVVDCPPSLGLSMDAAIYYGRRRDGEDPGASGIVIPVWAEDSSADAFTLLTGQIEDLRSDMQLDVDYLGLVVNMYDARRGYVATSSLTAWKDIGDPAVIAVVPDRKEQREAVRAKQPLLSYEPRSTQADKMREIARTLG